MSVMFSTTWDSQNGPVSSENIVSGKHSKKRKRPSSSNNKEDDIDLKGVEINIEKLMKKMQEEDDRINNGKAGGATSSGEWVQGGDGERNNKRRKEDKQSRRESVPNGKPKPHQQPNSNAGKRTSQASTPSALPTGKRVSVDQSSKAPVSSKGSSKRKRDDHLTGPAPASSPSKSFSEPAMSNNGPNGKSKKALNKERRAKAAQLETMDQPAAAPPAPSKAPVAAKLTDLQAKMKRSLDGAKFRWINEQLYTSLSDNAHQLMKEQPELYQDYHIGFSSQVDSWPNPPLTSIIEAITKLPKDILIADLGSGPASLARAIVPRGYKVLSYDLVGDDWVVEADFCQRIPLPGVEGVEDSPAIVDVCVCALSLMSLNWIAGVREANRVMKSGGSLYVAEVTSRFTDVQAFVDVICGIGFRCVKRDDSNTHFMLFSFKKANNDFVSDNEWASIEQRAATILKPCEYKRR